LRLADRTCLGPRLTRAVLPAASLYRSERCAPSLAGWTPVVHHLAVASAKFLPSRPQVFAQPAAGLCPAGRRAGESAAVTCPVPPNPVRMPAAGLPCLAGGLCSSGWGLRSYAGPVRRSALAAIADTRQQRQRLRRHGCDTSASRNSAWARRTTGGLLLALTESRWAEKGLLLALLLDDRPSHVVAATRADDMRRDRRAAVRARAQLTGLQAVMRATMAGTRVGLFAFGDRHGTPFEICPEGTSSSM